MKILQEPRHQPYAMKYKETIVNANNGKLYIYDCNGTYVEIDNTSAEGSRHYHTEDIIGDGVTYDFTINHNLGQRYPVVQTLSNFNPESDPRSGFISGYIEYVDDNTLILRSRTDIPAPGVDFDVTVMVVA